MVSFVSFRSSPLLYPSLASPDLAMRLIGALSSLLALASIAVAQHTGPVGPTTSLASKSAKICSVLDYGVRPFGLACTTSLTELRVSLSGQSRQQDRHRACHHLGLLVVYSQEHTIDTLHPSRHVLASFDRPTGRRKGVGNAHRRLDHRQLRRNHRWEPPRTYRSSLFVSFRHSDGSSSPQILKNMDDVEVYSSNGLGAINGQGYIWRIKVQAGLLSCFHCSARS